MKHLRRVGAVVIASSLLCGFVVGAGGSAATAKSNPVADPPTSAALVQATNAMLQPDQVTGVLATGTSGGSTFRSGFNNPPGGQDPRNVCGSGSKSVSVPGDSAIGYESSSGNVTQSVYEYPSVAVALNAWNRVKTKAVARCTGSVKGKGLPRQTLRTTAVPGLADATDGFAVLAQGGQNYYLVAHLTGSAISVLSYDSGDNSVAPVALPQVQVLAANLVGSWTQRATASPSQNPVIAKAEALMLTSSDVPADLPVVSPADGGWSGFSSYHPGSEPMTCNFRAKLPKAAYSFSATPGSSGDVLSVPGTLVQYVNVYPNPTAAAAAWAKVSAVVVGCHKNKAAQYPDGGTSALKFGGVAGAWSRDLFRFGGEGTKAYSIYLLMGDSIQTLIYATSGKNTHKIALDQVPVNALAVKLAQRWVNG